MYKEPEDAYRKTFHLAKIYERIDLRESLLPWYRLYLELQDDIRHLNEKIKIIKPGGENKKYEKYLSINDSMGEPNSGPFALVSYQLLGLPQFITGPLVNAFLLLATMVVGFQVEWLLVYYTLGSFLGVITLPWDR